MFTEKTTISEVLETPEFSDVAPLLFPIHLSLDHQLTLDVVAQHFPWYSFTSTIRRRLILIPTMVCASFGKTNKEKYMSMFFINISPAKKKETDLRLNELFLSQFDIY